MSLFLWLVTDPSTDADHILLCRCCHQLSKLQNLKNDRKAQLERLGLCQKICDLMLLETPLELLNRGRPPRTISLSRSDLVKHMSDLIKDLLALVCNLPGCLFGLM